VLRAGLASDAELVQAGWRAGSAGDVGLCARVMGRLGQAPRSLGTEGRVVGALLAAVEGVLRGYPHSLEQDEAELQQLEGGEAQAEAGLGALQPQQQAGAAAAGGVEQREQQQRARLIRVSILKGLVSEKQALVGSRAVLQGWQAALQQLGASGGAAAVTPEQLAAVYELLSGDE
jgi:hypothetical protein